MPAQQTVREGDTIAVWFSCGAASAVAAKRTVEKYGDIATIRVMNNPIVEEHDDNQRFLRDVEEWIGVPIEHVRSSKYPSQSVVEVWDDRNYMAGIAGAPCTLELKKKARQEWEDRNEWDWLVLGFTAEEKKRHDMFVLTERNNLLPVLIEDGITKADCYVRVLEAGIELPEIYRMGYPNANCIGCVKATSPTYWNHVRERHPDVFAERAVQSRRIGARLVRVKGERLFLDELDPEARGQRLKDMDFECGIFCSEYQAEDACEV